MEMCRVASFKHFLYWHVGFKQTNHHIDLGIYIYTYMCVYIICNVYYNVCCTPKQKAKIHERKIHCMGEPRLDHLKDLVVHVAIPVETPLELDGVGISQIPFR